MKLRRSDNSCIHYHILCGIACSVRTAQFSPLQKSCKSFLFSGYKTDTRISFCFRAKKNLKARGFSSWLV